MKNRTTLYKTMLLGFFFLLLQNAIHAQDLCNLYPIDGNSVAIEIDNPAGGITQELRDIFTELDCSEYDNTDVTITIKNGTYNMDEQVLPGSSTLKINYNLNILGEGDVVINCSVNTFLRIECHKSVFENIDNFEVGKVEGQEYTNTLSLDIVPDTGDVILLECTDESGIVETGWNTKKRDLFQIQDGEVSAGDNESELSLTRDYHFHYHSDETVNATIYQSKSFSLSNIDFQYSVIPNTHYSLFLLEGFKTINVSNTSCLLVNETSEFVYSFIVARNSTNLNLSTINMVNLHYGLLIQSCKTVTIQDITGGNCVHPVAPTLWCSDVTVDGMNCSDCSVDSHPSFDVEYRNVEILEGGGMNCRSFGVRIENATIINDQAQGHESLFSLPNVAADYEYLSQEHDVVLNNVKLKLPCGPTYGRGSGFYIKPCRSVIIDGCEVHSVLVSSGNQSNSVQEINISNSKIGTFMQASTGAHVMNIVNTTFDGSLQGYNGSVSCEFEPLYLRKGATFDNCCFMNYNEDAHLFQHLEGSNNVLKDVYFNHCSFQKFAGLRGNTHPSDYQYCGGKIIFDYCKFNNTEVGDGCNQFPFPDPNCTLTNINTNCGTIPSCEDSDLGLEISQTDLGNNEILLCVNVADLAPSVYNFEWSNGSTEPCITVSLSSEGTEYSVIAREMCCNVSASTSTLVCIDQDGDGVCEIDDCDDTDENIPAIIGSACDDGNSNTVNDVILSDRCTCQGTPIVSKVCNATYSLYGSSLEVANIAAPYISIRLSKLINNNQLILIYECTDNNCSDPTIIDNLETGKYFLEIYTWSETGKSICQIGQILKVNSEQGLNGGLERTALSSTLDNTKEALTIFPNPANDIISIRFENENNLPGTILLLDQLGQTKLTQELSEATNKAIEINIDEIPSGLYFIYVKKDGMEAICEKLIIAR